MFAVQFNFGIFSLVGVILLVLAGTSFGYLFALKNKSAASRMLMWFFLSVCVSGAATLLTNLGTSWAWAFAPAQDASLIVGGVFLIQFAYQYPTNDQPREAQRAFILYLALALFALGYAVYFAVQYLAHLPDDIQESQAFYLLTPLALLVLVGAFFRRFLRWRQRLAARAEGTAQFVQDSDQRSANLDRQAAAALRNFGIALSLGLIPLVVFLLPDDFPELLASFFFNFGVVLAISALMLVYLSHAPDPTTISARLVGITLATVLLVIGLAAVWFTLYMPSTQTSVMVLAFIVLVLLSSLLILLVFPLFFRYTLLRPLDRLLEGIRRANAGDLESRVPLQFEDEIGFLTRAFNRMANTLHEKSMALVDATIHLEQQVGERTSALEAANAGLRLQNNYQLALSRCSQVLLLPATTRPERLDLLNQAVAHLMEAVSASRAYIFENKLDAEGNESMGMLAESVAEGVPPHLPQSVNQDFPWALLPEEMYAALRDRQPYGGPVESSFAQTTELRDSFLDQQPPLLSVQLFPIHLYAQWWGFIGFDDCQQPRVWHADEIQVLRTGAEMIVSVLLRWQREDAHQLQALAQEALARSSQRLLQPAGSVAQREAALSAALGFLVESAGVSRGFLFENLEHPRDGYCLQLVAQATAPGVEARLGGPFAAHVPWALLPAETRTMLEQHQPVSGPVERVLAGSPHIQDALASDPALSVLFFPIFFGDRWWGMVGFDDFETLRDWGEPEALLLHTGAEILSQTLQRWLAEDQLQHTLNDLENRVQQRTRQLSLANTRLLAEIEDRRAAEQNLQMQLQMEMILAGISEDLMSATDQEGAIYQALAGLGELFQPRRVSLALLAERQEFVVEEVYSWQSPQATSLTQEDAQIVLSTLVWSTGQLAEHQPVYLREPHNLPQEAGAEMNYLHQQDLHSLLLVPLVARNLLIGVLMCENISTAKELFTETRRLLEVVAGILSSALAHQQLLGDLEQKINLRTRELAALYDLAILGGRSASLGDVLLPMLSRILEITSSNAASLHIVGDDTLHLVVHLGLSASQLSQQEQIELKPALKDWLSSASASPAERLESESRLQHDLFAIPDFAQMRLVRLHARDHGLGILCCYRRENIRYNPHEFSTLVAIGEQLGVIIENHRLRLEAEAFAGLRERQRLARELHDSVSQSLYSLTLFARAGRDALEASDLQKLSLSLEEVEENSKAALRAMRLLLYELRTEAVSAGLRQALIDRFQMVENRLGIQTELAVDDPLALEPRVERELFWLITEALNNAVKHADAGKVLVSLKQNPGGLELSVVDDGRGFDPRHASAGIGLSSMQERAELLGGTLEILSQAGAGTQVRLRLPHKTSRNGGA